MTKLRHSAIIPNNKSMEVEQASVFSFSESRRLVRDGMEAECELTTELSFRTRAARDARNAPGLMRRADFRIRRVHPLKQTE